MLSDSLPERNTDIRETLDQVYVQVKEDCRKKKEEYYSLREMKTIIDYIIRHEAYAETKGNDLWKKIVETTETKRSWQSLQLTFNNTILPMIDNNYFRLTFNQINSFREGFEIGEFAKNNELQHERDNSNENSVNLKPLPSLIETFGKGFVDATGVLPSPIRFIYLNDVSEFPEICKTWKALKKKKFVPMEEPMAEMESMAEEEPVIETIPNSIPIVEEELFKSIKSALSRPLNVEQGNKLELYKSINSALSRPLNVELENKPKKYNKDEKKGQYAIGLAESIEEAEADLVTESIEEAESVLETIPEAKWVTQVESVIQPEFFESKRSAPPRPLNVEHENKPVFFKSIRSAPSRSLNVEHENKPELFKSIKSALSRPLNVELENKPKKYNEDQKKGQYAIGLAKPIEEAEAGLVTQSIEEAESVLETIPEAKPVLEAKCVTQVESVIQPKFLKSKRRAPPRPLKVELKKKPKKYNKGKGKGQYAIGLAKPIEEAEADLVTESIEETESVLETIPEAKSVGESKCVTQVESVIQPKLLKSKRRAPPRPLKVELKKKPKKYNKGKGKGQYAIGLAKPIEEAEADLVTESIEETESVLETIPEAKSVGESKCVMQVESVIQPKFLKSKRRAPPRPLKVELKKKPKKYNKDKGKGQYAIGLAKPIEEAETDLVTETIEEAESVLETIPEANCVTQVESVNIKLEKKPKKYNKDKKKETNKIGIRKSPRIANAMKKMMDFYCEWK